MPNNRTKVFNNKLYYGAGSVAYTTDGNVTIGYAGVWDGQAGTAGWSSLDGGITTGYGRGIYVVDENHIYVFGKFSVIGVDNPLSNGGNDFCLAKWNGTQWSAVGTIGTTDNEIKDVCYDADNDILYACGQFTSIYGVSANRIAKFEGGSWSALGSGGTGTIYSCCVDSNYNLYCCGSAYFNVASTTGLARWNFSGEIWESISSGNNNTGWDVVYASDNDSVYLTGSFSGVDGVANTKLLARYSVAEDQWYSISTFGGSDTQIYDIDYAGDGKLYFGGYTETHGDDVGYYDGTSSWTGYGKNDGYTLNPDQTTFGLIDLVADNDGNVYVNRNASGFYILVSGETQWNRLDNLAGDVTIGKAATYVEEEVVVEEEIESYVATRPNLWFLSYTDSSSESAKSPIPGDMMLDLSSRNNYQYVGITDATGPEGNWVVNSGGSMTFSNHSSLRSALEKVPDQISGTRGYVHLMDASPKYNGYPTTFVVDTDGSTGPSSYNVDPVEKEIRKTLWRPDMNEVFSLFAPTPLADYVLLVGPLGDGHQDGMSYLPADYNY